MGRLVGFRRRGTIPAFEEALTRLQGELALTERFAGSMMRDGHHKAALAVIDEQRGRLAEAEASMRAAFRRPRRLQAAFGGIAAVMILGSASLAAFAVRSSQPSAPAVLERVERKFERAAATADTGRAASIVSEALDDIAAMDPSTFDDQEFRDQVRDLLAEQLARVQRHPSLRKLATRISEIAERVKAEVDDEHDSEVPPPSAPESEAPSSAPASTPAAPAP